MGADVETAAAGPDEGYVAERWTYAGQAAGAKRVAVEVWWPLEGEALSYKPTPRTSFVAGGLYEVLVRRTPEGRTYKRGVPEFIGLHPDREVRAAAQAEATAGGRELARDQLERKARNMGPLADLLAEVARVAGPMTHRQRDALVSLLQREVYTAVRGAR